MREEGGRWRTASEGSEDRWKAKSEDDTRWSRHDEDRQRGGGTRRQPSRDRSPRPRSRERRDGGGRRSYRNDRMVYISNIPYDVRWMELKDLIREKAGELPTDYTWQIVRDRVQQFGPVDMTEMIAPGCAKVTFSLATDAERARKTLQNTTVEGRLIGVEFLA